MKKPSNYALTLFVSFGLSLAVGTAILFGINILTCLIFGIVFSWQVALVGAFSAVWVFLWVSAYFADEEKVKMGMSDNPPEHDPYDQDNNHEDDPPPPPPAS